MREVAMASLPFTTTPAILTGPAKYNLQLTEGKPLAIANCLWVCQFFREQRRLNRHDAKTPR
jgi:hypothetical protein